ncbi:MAG: hypothetical protein ACYCQJ_10985 [Nitrososphaerales archaeon]
MTRREDLPDAVKRAHAILELDDSIFAVGIISNSGEPLGAASRESFRKDKFEEQWGLGKFTEKWAAEAFRSATMVASARANEKILSRLEAIIMIREKFNILLLSLLPQEPIIIAALFEKNSDGQILCRKILNYTKTS